MGPASIRHPALARRVARQAARGREILDDRAAACPEGFGLPTGDRLFRRRADQMGSGHGRVPWIEHGSLEGAVEQRIGVRDQVLVQRVRHRDQDDERVSAFAPDAPDPLPRGRARSRVAHEHADVEAADVDAELERARREDREQLSGKQLLLDRAVAPRAGTPRDTARSCA
jgi:hypothetical protein